MANENDPSSETGPNTDGGASLAELREFLGQMRGRSPREMVGLVAESGLTRSMLLATFLVLLLLVVLTVVPYALNDRAAEATTPLVEEPSPAVETLPAVREPAEPIESVPDTDPDRAVDAMGISGARVADPEVNPLEDKLDKLLDGIE